MLPISVCIIAKNEEKHIEECLRRLKPYQYEIVLVDTGSTDRTVEIAKNYTDRIYSFDWCDDFSAAKNYAMSKASHDWVLSLDCDEYVETIDEGSMQKQMQANPQAAGRILLKNRFMQDGQPSTEYVRLSRLVNRHYFHFAGAVHEQLEPIAADISKTVYDIPVTVLHVGYDGSEEAMRRKSLRNIFLLEKELQKQGPDAYLYFQLGQSYMKLEDYKKAYDWFDQGLSMDVDPSLNYVQLMVESYGYCLLNLKRYRDALQLSNIYDTFAVTADFVFLMGLIYMNNGLFTEAVEEFEKSTTIERFSVEGTNSYRSFYNIGVIYECTGHLKEARSYYRKCGDFEPALTRLRAI